MTWIFHSTVKSICVNPQWIFLTSNLQLFSKTFMAKFHNWHCHKITKGLLSASTIHFKLDFLPLQNNVFNVWQMIFKSHCPGGASLAEVQISHYKIVIIIICTFQAVLRTIIQWFRLSVVIRTLYCSISPYQITLG